MYAIGAVLHTQTENSEHRIESRVELQLFGQLLIWHNAQSGKLSRLLIRKQNKVGLSIGDSIVEF